MERPLISIIIPTYQHAQTIAACLDSIFAQTYSNFEVIVVNDGSTDKTIEVLEPYKNRIKLVNQINQGSNPARNRGLKEAQGELVIFCDADVRMKPEMLETLYKRLFEHPEASFAYCSFRFGWKLFKGVPYSIEQLRLENFAHTTSLVRRKDFPGFDEDIKRLQDWDVWLTMSEQGKSGILVDEVLFDVEISGDSRIGSSWLPSFIYRLPWSKIGWKPKQVEKYEKAREIIAKKHNL